jgi:hypothetical protein
MNTIKSMRLKGEEYSILTNYYAGNVGYRTIALYNTNPVLLEEGEVLHRYDMHEILKLIDQSLKNVALAYSILHPKYKKIAKDKHLKGRHITWGHCYVVSETFYHLIGKDYGWFPHVIRMGSGGTHWFLKQMEKGVGYGNIIDPTVGQFGGFIPDYSKGRACGFLTKKPSKRSKILIDHIFRIM